MVNGYHNSDWTSGNRPILKPVRKSVWELIDQKLERFKTAISFIAVIGGFFIGGIIIGETSQSHERQKAFFREHLQKTDSLIQIQKQFQELYRVQRAADRYLYEMYFIQLSQTDSLLMKMVNR